MNAEDYKEMIPVSLSVFDSITSASYSALLGEDGDWENTYNTQRWVIAYWVEKFTKARGVWDESFMLSFDIGELPLPTHLQPAENTDEAFMAGGIDKV